MCHNDLDRFQNWITRLICYGTSTPRVLGLEGCYCESYTNLKEYFWAFLRFLSTLSVKCPCKRDIQQQSVIIFQ